MSTIRQSAFDFITRFLEEMLSFVRVPFQGRWKWRGIA
jgi:hypothetical protein